MVSKYTQPELISPDEVISLSKYITADEVQRAREIAEIWHHPHSKHPDFDYYCMLSAIYAAGRIQGIRESRARMRIKGIVKQKKERATHDTY